MHKANSSIKNVCNAPKENTLRSQAVKHTKGEAELRRRKSDAILPLLLNKTQDKRLLLISDIQREARRMRKEKEKKMKVILRVKLRVIDSKPANAKKDSADFLNRVINENKPIKRFFCKRCKTLKRDNRYVEWKGQLITRCHCGYGHMKEDINNDKGGDANGR